MNALALARKIGPKNYFVRTIIIVKETAGAHGLPLGPPDKDLRSTDGSQMLGEFDRHLNEYAGENHWHRYFPEGKHAGKLMIRLELRHPMHQRGEPIASAEIIHERTSEGTIRTHIIPKQMHGLPSL